MELDPEEQQIILQHRRQKNEALRVRQIHLLDVALRYVRFLHMEDVEPTESGFIYNFGYEPEPGEDWQILYCRVEELMRQAASIVGN